MFSRILACALLGGALIVGGCEKKEETAPITPPGKIPTPSATDVDKAASDAGAAVDAAKTDAAAAVDQAASDAGAAADAAKTDAAAAADSAGETAAAAGADVSAEATKLIDQATTYIKENKWDLAESTVKQLEGMKASLPADYQGQVDNVRKMLDTAKAAAGSGIKLPGT